MQKYITILSIIILKLNYQSYNWCFKRSTAAYLDGFDLIQESVDLFLGEFSDLFFHLSVALGFFRQIGGVLNDFLHDGLEFFVEFLYIRQLFGKVLGVSENGRLPLFGGFFDNVGNSGFAVKLRNIINN